MPIVNRLPGGGGRAGGRASLAGQRGAAVHPGDQVAGGQRGDVAANGQLADPESRASSRHPHGAEPAQLAEQPLVPLHLEEAFVGHHALQTGGRSATFVS